MRGIVTALLGYAVLMVFASGASPHAGHAPLEIDIANSAFAPQEAQIYQGDSVVFAWKGPDTDHSATADDGSFDTGAAHIPGDTYAVSFSKLGTFTYHCKVHKYMTGKVVVNPIPGAPAPQAPVLTRVSASPKSFSRKTTLRLTLDSPSSIRAKLQKGSKVVKEIDFNAHPGANSKKLDFGKRVKAGKYTLKVVAIDPSSGLSSKQASVKVTVKKAAGGAKAASLNYPPINCGRIAYKSMRLNVKTHGPSCTTAISGVKGYLAHKRSPRYYKCKSYGGDIPAYCIGAIAKYKKRYFFANKV